MSEEQIGLKPGKDLVTAERRRQIKAEGWSHDHDDSQGSDVLENAALSYRDASGPDSTMPQHWPWPREWWKPRTRQRNLEKAGALYLAAAETAERAKDYEERDRLTGQVNSCIALLDSIVGQLLDRNSEG